MKLIKFQVQNIEVPHDWERPYYRTLEREGMNRLVSIYDESVTTMSMKNVKEVDYEMVYLRDGEKRWKFYVNFEEAKLAMPLLEGIVNNQTKKIKKENIDLKVQRAQLIDGVKYYENLWFVRFHSWIKKLIKSL